VKQRALGAILDARPCYAAAMRTLLILFFYAGCGTEATVCAPSCPTADADAVCKSADAKTCGDCCAQHHAAAYQRLETLVESCLCAHCPTCNASSSCGQTGTVTDECARCLGPVFQSCAETAQADCAHDSACASYAECTARECN
jgi:hypothetical protein